WLVSLPKYPVWRPDRAEPHTITRIRRRIIMSDPDLFAELEQVEDLSRAERARTLRREKDHGPGPNTEGVSKQIRRLAASGTYSQIDQIIDRDEYAAVIALCRQLARAVDKATGHNETGWHANGRDLGPLAEQLRQAHEMLRP